MLAAILILIALFVAWIVALIIRTARLERKQRKDLEAIRHMDSSELSDYLNLKK